MWIPLGARWDQEPAGSLVVPTPKKIAGSVAGERGGKGGEREKILCEHGKIFKNVTKYISPKK